MNCTEITSLLNAHETGSLDSARAIAVEAHLSTCAECAGAWRVADALRRERWPAPPRDLLARIAGRLDRPLDAPAVPAGRDADAAEASDRGRRAVVRRAAGLGLLAASVALALGLAVQLGADKPAEQREALADSPPAPSRSAAPNDDADATTRQARSAAPSDGAARNAFEPGRHYRLVAGAPGPMARLGMAGGSESGSAAGAIPARVEVVQFFMYGCFPCYAFEPAIDGWETKAEHIELLRVPVVFNAVAELHARAFYAAEALGKLDDVHDALFTEIHARGNRLDSEASIGELFARLGVPEEAFRRAFGSAEVDEKVAAAIDLARSLGVTATPSLVVARRYLTSPSMTGSYDETLAVVDALAESVYEEAGRADRCERGVRADGGERVRDRQPAETADSMEQLTDLVARGCATDIF